MKLNEIVPQTFENVTIYVDGMFGIIRIDCRTLELREGYSYAQYENAVHIQYLEKGKRKPKAMVLSSLPFLIVVETKHAIKPQDAMVKHGNDGATITRYASCDSRWRSDFMAALEQAKTPILKDYASWNAASKYAKV